MRVRPRAMGFGRRGGALAVVAALAATLVPGAPARAVFWQQSLLTSNLLEDRDPLIDVPHVVWRRFNPQSNHFDLYARELPAGPEERLFEFVPSVLSGQPTYHVGGGSAVWSRDGSIFHRDLVAGQTTEIPLPAGIDIEPASIRVDPPYILWRSNAFQVHLYELGSGAITPLSNPSTFAVSSVIAKPHVAWIEAGNVQLHDLETGFTIQINDDGTAQTVALAPPDLVWSSDGSIHHYRIDTEQAAPLVEGENLCFAEGPFVSRGRVAWCRMTAAGGEMRLHDLETGLTVTVSDPTRSAFRLALSGPNVLFIERAPDVDELIAYDAESGTRSTVRMGLLFFGGPKASRNMAVLKDFRRVGAAFQGDIVWVRRNDDGDADPNDFDNCTQVWNFDQLDGDADGFGNACDADLNQDGIADFLDLALLRSVFASDDAVADLDGSGSVGPEDVTIMKSGFFRPPGPSGLVD